MRDLYLDLLEKTLTDLHRIEMGEFRPLTWGKLSLKQKMLRPLDWALNKKGYTIAKYIPPDRKKRLVGADWPSYADTMIGLARLQNIRFCVTDTIKNQVAGDLIETGVWRGGATIFMRAILKAYNVHDKNVWVADSFEGLPKPNEEKYVHDKGDKHFTEDALKVSLEDVKRNFEKYDLLDDQVKFLKGWFKDTLPVAPISKLSVLRLDGDMYESTMDALINLYPKLSVGGYIIIDDWNAVKACKQAVEDYRAQFSINEKIEQIDWASVYWKKLN
ncbi:MAG TPA: TylF/MycF family methyltransferase [Chryseosolibacter sp.]